jgi:hypothetical protein
MPKWLWNAETSKKDTRMIEALEEILRNKKEVKFETLGYQPDKIEIKNPLPPCGGSAVNNAITKENVVMVVYAYQLFSINNCSIPWIYGVYGNRSEGFAKMKEMQESEEYGHLTWTNNLVLLK